MTDLSRRDAGLRELMDDPACDPVRLRRTLERFGTVNRLVSGWAATYRTYDPAGGVDVEFNSPDCPAR